MSGIALKLIKLAGVVMIIAILLRLFGFNDMKGIPLFGVTPGAFHRLTDTLLLFSIALSLWGIGNKNISS